MNAFKLAHRPASLTDSSQPTFRSGAVARMAGMPVATLRIWEQRYQAVKPTTAASGHRLYSAADVERVTLLRRLTEQGHAIGLLAALDIEQLRQMIRLPTSTESAEKRDVPSQREAMRIVVVGDALARRVQRVISRQPGRPAPQWAGVFDSLADSVAAAEHLTEPGIDLLLWQAPSLQPGVRHELRAAQDAWRARATAVVYRYSSAAGRAELAGTGTAMLHEPADDESLGQWLATLERHGKAASGDRREFQPDHADVMDLADRAASAPRFTEASLTEFAELSSTIACECPSHLAQLLLQISSFEAYSGDCAHRSAADAQLHAYLQRVAGAARMLFETALEQVAIAEGLPLPSSASGASNTSGGSSSSPTNARHVPAGDSL